jgi:hypothetical protein
MNEEMHTSNYIMNWLGLLEVETGRFRGCGPANWRGQDCFVIHTRNGASNKEDYVDEIVKMRKHPFYLWDEKDDFDNTYMNFYFLAPKKEEKK